MKKLLLIMLFFTANFIFSQSWELDESFTSSDGGDFGYAIDLSGDGNVLAVGAYNDDTIDTNAGKVQVFQKTSTGWQQMGSSLFGASSSDNFGKDVSLSTDGQILAVGIPGSDGNGMYSGEVKIYKYDGNDWGQIGNSVYGDSWEFAGKAISLNDDGSVLAVGIYNTTMIMVMMPVWFAFINTELRVGRKKVLKFTEPVITIISEVQFP